MSNVVDFTNHTPPNGSPESRARRAEDLRAMGRAGYRPSATDRERIAENLFRLLARLEADKGGRRAALCRTVLNAPDHESTKRLRYFELDPEREGKAREKQLNTLTTKITKYIDLAEAAAIEAREDVDAVLLNLVHGTSLPRAGSLPPEDPMTRDLKGQLIRHLERAASRVTSETGLQRAFQMIARYRLCADPSLEDNFIAGPVNDAPLSLEDGSTSPPPRTAGQEDWWRLVGNAPKALLGETNLDRVKGELKFERHGKFLIIPHNPNNSTIKKLPDKDIEPREGEHWSAVTDYRAQVWLGLLPFGLSHEPRLGLFLKLLRYVHIERLHSNGPLAPSESPAWENIHSERIYDLRSSAHWSSAKEDLRVTLPVDLAPLNPSLDLLLGRKLYQDEACPARVLAFSSGEAQRVLELLDNQTISDWVGPLPDIFYSGGIRPGPEPSDWARWQDWQSANQEATERDEKYRFRFLSHSSDSNPAERYPMIWKKGTLGYKLERSLLEMDGDDGVIQQLRAQANALVDAVEDKTGAALSAREGRLAGLHSTYEVGSNGEPA